MKVLFLFLQVRFSQDWRNLPVYGFDIVLEQENDTNLILESADGEFLSGIEEDIPSEVPAISKEEAIQLAIDYNQDQGKQLENVRIWKVNPEQCKDFLVGKDRFRQYIIWYTLIQDSL